MKVELREEETAAALHPADRAPTLPLARFFHERLARLHPAYFALAMATGIVSIDCHLLGLREIAGALFWLNVPAYVALWLIFIARALLYPARFFSDWSHHQRGPGFFTSAAATGVVGVQVALMGGSPQAARAFWWLALALWATCTYAIFVSLCVKEKKPSLAEGINGGWLVAVVAAQSVCTLGCASELLLFGDRNLTLILLMSFWLFGGMLYVWMISLIFYRYMFFSFAPTDLMPPYWINMGAVAISTLAGASLVSFGRDSSLMASMLPFVKGMTMMYWATATWWIPMLLILGVWRHRVRRFVFVYEPLYWGLVFPLGMYSVCTLRLSQMFEVPALLWIAKGFVVAALSAWLLTFLGMAKLFLYALLLAARSLQSIWAPGSGRPVELQKTGG